ncbi:MAG: trypsin-like peptidase domain-containing protein [Planctomycetaceae bacterium]
MKLIRSSSLWLLSVACGVCVVAAVGFGQRSGNTKIATAATAVELSSVFREVSRKVLPSVVSIRVKQKLPAGSAGNGNEDLEKFFEEHPELPERFREFFGRQGSSAPRNPQGMGSGFIIDRRGTILTNYHVVRNAEELVVRLHDGREFVAKDVKGDPRTDVAIIRIEGAGDLSPVMLGDSDRIQVGDWVLAVGSPFGLDLTVTAGIISAKGRGPGIAEREDFLQTDAAINPGNSGGPLVDMSGRVVGINTAIATSTRSSAGVGFAVPVNMVRWVSRQLIDNGSVKRAWLGVGVRPVDAKVARKFDVKIGQGAIVGQVMQESPAARAGLVTDDIILKFNNQVVNGPRSLQGIVERLEVGKTYAMSVRRSGKARPIKVTVAEMPKRPRLVPRRDPGKKRQPPE